MGDPRTSQPGVNTELEEASEKTKTAENAVTNVDLDTGKENAERETLNKPEELRYVRIQNAEGDTKKGT